MALSAAPQQVRALAFDVFGTVVDWRGSIIREGEALGRTKGITVDWAAFADAWRGLYQPQLSKVRQGERPWVKLDVLHRESLDSLLGRFGLAALSEAEREHLNRVWHRLDPWPDSVPGLKRLHAKYILTTLSNGNVSLMIDMARRAGLPWDAILGAEPTHSYKPQPQAYLGTADYLGLAPQQCMLVAAHPDDLRMAQSLGFRAAYVQRPLEHGPGRAAPPGDPSFDFTINGMEELAAALGC